MATDIQELREARADARAQIFALVTQLSRLDETMHDSNIIMENQRATIRAFASDTESILTCSLLEPPRTPSLQVSTMVANSTRSASFVTAWTSVDLTVAGEEITVVRTRVTVFVAHSLAGIVLRNTAHDISALQSATVFANFGAIGTGVQFYSHDQEWKIFVCSTGVQNNIRGSLGVALLENADNQGENMEVFRAHQQVTPRLTLWKTISRRILIPTWRRPSRRRT
jgi:hypothetical protein